MKDDFQDLSCEGNSPKYHTGKKCIEKGCFNPAGTAWSPFWCVKHNIERINRITKQLEDLSNGIITERPCPI